MMRQKRTYLLLIAATLPALFGILSAGASPVFRPAGFEETAPGEKPLGPVASLLRRLLLKGHVGDDPMPDGADRLAATIPGANQPPASDPTAPMIGIWYRAALLASLIRGAAGDPWQGALLSAGPINGPVWVGRTGGGIPGGGGSGGGSGGAGPSYGSTPPTPLLILAIDDEPGLGGDDEEAVTATPTPVPAALPLFLAGLVGLGLIGSGRRRS